MGALESMNSSVSFVIWCHRDIVLPSLRHPTGHGKGRRRRRYHSSRPVWCVTAVSDETTIVNKQRYGGKSLTVLTG